MEKEHEHWDKSEQQEREVELNLISDDPFADMFIDPRNVQDDLVFKMCSLDYDAKCQYDLMNGYGFMITNTSWADKQCMYPNADGPRSTNFGFPENVINRLWYAPLFLSAKYMASPIEVAIGLPNIEPDTSAITTAFTSPST